MSANTGSATASGISRRAILHVDCDAFFASCEEARDPSLRGKPIATGKERGIVSCPSYAAKAAGVARGMRLGEARALCPELIVLPSDYETYSIYSERIFAILRRFTPDVEEYSIDEAFCDITGLRRLHHASYEHIALKIKETVRAELGITVSVGLAPTKILAKLCSKHRKPDGFTAVSAGLGGSLETFLAGMPLERVCGFGPNSVALLEKHGVRDVLGFIKRPLAFADKLLGKVGRELCLELGGIQVYGISTEPKDKYLSISKTKTFSPSSADRDFVRSKLVRNLESACIKLRRHRLAARSLTVYLRRADFTARAAEARLTRRTASTTDFAQAASELFGPLFEPGALYRATGVVLSDIEAEGTVPADLFDDSVKIERTRRLSRTIDDINSHFGKHAIYLASAGMASNPPRDIKMSQDENPRSDKVWRRKELLKGETDRKRLALPLFNIKV